MYIQYTRTAGKRKCDCILYSSSNSFDMHCCCCYHYFVKFEHCVLFIPYLRVSAVRSIKGRVKFFRETDFVIFFIWINENQKESEITRNSMVVPFCRSMRNVGWFICQRAVHTYDIFDEWHVFTFKSVRFFSLFGLHALCAAAAVIVLVFSSRNTWYSLVGHTISCIWRPKDCSLYKQKENECKEDWRV